jgi:hypothetical protein
MDAPRITRVPIMPDIQEPDQPTYRDGYTEERTPLRATWYFRDNKTGGVVEVDALVMDADDWPEQEEASVSYGGCSTSTPNRCPQGVHLIASTDSWRAASLHRIEGDYDGG